MRLGQYEVKRSSDGEWYWVLSARNGQVLCTSELYTTKAMCEKGIRAARLAAPLASVKERWM